MFACLYLPPSPMRRAVPAIGPARDRTSLAEIARKVSPRVDVRRENLVVLDAEGLERLVGDARAVGERLRREAADRGFAPVHVAIAGTRTAAMLLAAARAGVTVVAPGGEAGALAPQPLRTLGELAVSAQPLAPRSLAPGLQPCAGTAHPERAAEAARRRASPEFRAPSPGCLSTLSRWGLRTLGELAALPSAELSERLGQDGVRWQRLARGEDTEPLVPAREDEPFESSLDLEWPIADLEPLSFVLGRLLDPLCARLESRDRGAAALHLRLRLVTRALHLRSLQLPAPMRDPKVLRTLLLLDLEAHPAPAGIDAVAIVIDPTPGRIVQESLLTRALPAPELVSTLVARLQALMGEGRCGSPATVDSYRPGAFAMTPFAVEQKQESRSRHAEAGMQEPSLEPLAPNPESRIPSAALRRFRIPIPARVLIDGHRPTSVRTDRQGLSGGQVRGWAGPWRTSGGWWKSGDSRRAGWNRDEWDVALSDGGLYRIFEDRDTGRWFVEAVED
ncbi:MAG TPA: hypothetical protein PLE61_03930 [Vicinamibacterales bacterium]|nr:hypothetical protein [Vicinamibacterales bacterium]HPW19943.1 hypothetical protein [Vicinamibacterales bacterium]